MIEMKGKTDHRECIEIIVDYSKKCRYLRILGEPNYEETQGPDLVLENLRDKCVEYIEVELDAKNTPDAQRIAKRAIQLASGNEMVRVWLVSCSNKWIESKKKTGVKNFIAADPRGRIYLENGRVEIERISPIQLGEAKRGGELRF